MRILNQSQCLDPHAVGAKFSRQAMLASRGIDIPEFFCLSADTGIEISSPIAFKRDQLLAQVDVHCLESVSHVSQAIQELYQSLSLPEAFAARIEKAWNDLGSEFVAVRSSMVSGNGEMTEDSQSDAYAGISASFLYVKRDQLWSKITACLASAYSVEALLYRGRQGLSLSDVAVAVGVQRMAFGERSFVLFTANPDSGARDAVLVAGYGIGEGIVQERVATDHYFIGFDEPSIKKTLANKESKLSLDQQTGAGLAFYPVDDVQARKPCLNDTEVQHIVAIGRKIERVFACPQDIEGTVLADGTIKILQSRPIVFELGVQRVWSNANITESFPGVSCALTYSLAKQFYRVIFHDVYRIMGIDRHTLNDNQDELNHMVGYLGGRIYYNMNAFYRLHKQSPLYFMNRHNWEKLMGMSSTFYTSSSEGELSNDRERKSSGLSSLKNIVRRITSILTHSRRTAWAIVVLIKLFVFHERDIRRFQSWWARRWQPLAGRSFDGSDPMQIRTLFAELWRDVGNHWGVTLTNDTYLPFFLGATESLFKRWGLDQHSALLNDLLCGDDQLLSVEIMMSSVRIAEKIAVAPALRAEFLQHDEHDLWQSLRDGRLDQAISSDINEHLRRYGDRGLQELKMEQPSLRDTPWVLLATLKQYIIVGLNEKSMLEEECRTRDAAEALLAESLKENPVKRFVIRVALNRLRTYIRHRENCRYARSELFGLSRKMFFGVGAYLQQQDIIDDQKEVLHLTQEELFGYIDGTGTLENLRTIIDQRRQEYTYYQHREVYSQITTHGAVRENALYDTESQTEENHAFSSETMTSAGELRGLGSSRGKVQGRAKVITNPMEHASLENGSILVARETDPGWLFLMLAAKGMVVERGSMLSHTAITARKFGIPTVVGVENATRLIPDGALIEIDGSTGQVTILEEASVEC